MTRPLNLVLVGALLLGGATVGALLLRGGDTHPPQAYPDAQHVRELQRPRGSGATRFSRGNPAVSDASHRSTSRPVSSGPEPLPATPTQGPHRHSVAPTAPSAHARPEANGTELRPEPSSDAPNLDLEKLPADPALPTPDTEPYESTPPEILALFDLPPENIGRYVTGLSRETETERQFSDSFRAAFQSPAVDLGLRECIAMINELRDMPSQLMVFEVQFSRRQNTTTAELVSVQTETLELEETECFEEVLREPLDTLGTPPLISNGGQHTVTYPVWVAEIH